MFVLSFALILSVLIILNNKMKDVSSENNDSYQFDRNSVLIILGLFLLGLVLNFVMKAFPSKYFIVLGVYSVVCAAGIIIANQLRIQRIEERREDIREVYKALNKIFKVKPDEELDMNNIPFEIEYSKEDPKKISLIKIEIDNPDYFTDHILTDAVNRLNKFFNYYQWLQQVDFPDRTCMFIGQKKPPRLALFPGSDLRPWNWIPLGVGSNGEVGWNLGAKKNSMGKSLFKYEDTGELAGTTDISKAPQCLTLGSTGGGKAIAIDEIVEVRRETE